MLKEISALLPSVIIHLTLVNVQFVHHSLHICYAGFILFFIFFDYVKEIISIKGDNN